MKRVPIVLMLALFFGVMFNALFVAAWVAYFWGDGDGERAVFLTGLEVITGPLLARAVLALRGRPSAVPLLRIGSVLFLVSPPWWRALWDIHLDPDYIAYVSARD